MKKLIFFVILMVGTISLALAQTKTPVVRHVSSNYSSQSSSINVPTHTFNAQLRKSMNQINKDMKSGKLTQSQAQAARAKVKAIRVQELQYFKANGNKQLNSDQLTKLNQSMAQLSL